MAAICLSLAIHEPYSLRRYTIFDINQSSIYQDDDRSCNQAMYYAQNCYLPLTELLYRQIRRFKDAFRFSISISGSAIDLFEQYTPEVIDGLKRLAETGCVEFISESGPHTLANFYSVEEFVHQVQEHTRRIRRVFGKVATTFRNTELLYNNDLARTIAQLGFSTVLTEGSPNILGWRNANYVYTSSVEPSLKLLLRNPDLSEDISQRFSRRDWSEWPLTAEKFAAWCSDLSSDADTINLFLDCHVFGLRNTKESGIFAFMEHLPEAVLAQKDLRFMTPKQVVRQYEPKDGLAVPDTISWNDEGSDIRGWLGNEMQKDAIKALYSLTSRIRSIGDEELIHDFERLQTSDYFHYMSTRWFSESQPDRPNPFQSPYDAYISFMNILVDLTERLRILEQEKTRKKPARRKTAETTASATKLAKSRSSVNSAKTQSTGSTKTAKTVESGKKTQGTNSRQRGRTGTKNSAQ